MNIRKRLLIGASAITGLGAAAMLVAGTTFGFFSANTSPGQSNSFASGTVSLGTPNAVHTCAVTNMVPGDESVGYAGTDTGQNDTKWATCEYQVQYTGSAPAFIGVTATVGGSNSALSNALVWQISSATGATNAVPADPGTATYTTGSASPLYVATDTGTDSYYTFYVDFLLPSTYTTQAAGTATLTLEVFAVQSQNNGSCTTQGTTCSGAWS